VISIDPVTLNGMCVRLEPLSWAHEADLVSVAADPAIWEYMPVRGDTAELFHALLSEALENGVRSTELPFAVIDLASGRAIGGTRVLDIRREHDAVEIGYTWYARRFWRTAVNTECKYLLLAHLFDTVGCRRVTLKTDRLNVRSQRGIERLGAVREGTLRKHMIVQDGRERDTVYYSVIDTEWPGVKARLEAFMAGGETPPRSPS
jgi:RimJ/RimL family protein N-acetyltransferase